MKVNELIEKLQKCDAEADVWLPAMNKEHIPTYSMLDYVDEFDFEYIVNDVIDNPGEIDHSLIDGKKDQKKVVCLSSIFGI